MFILFFITQAFSKCWCSVQTVAWLWKNKEWSAYFTWEEESISSAGTEMGMAYTNSAEHYT